MRPPFATVVTAVLAASAWGCEDPAIGEPRDNTALQQINTAQNGFFNGSARCLACSG